MKSPHFFALLLAFSIFPAVNAQETSSSFSLFDGKSLSGWDYDPKIWRVEDGVITGGSRTEKIDKNYFIATGRSFQNFELKLTIKCSGDPKTGLINSGIQIRSQRVPGGAHVAGYQIDCGKGWFGKIYDEYRRRSVIAEPVDAEALAKVVDVYGWNEYRIRAEGPRIRVWINDVLATDYTENNPNVALDGVIAPQVHSGGAALVQFKDVSITKFPDTPGAPTWKSLGGLEAALKKAPPVPKKRKPRASVKAANKIPALPKGDDRVNFDFESGDLQGWFITEGWFNHLIADNKTIRAGGGPSNKEGKYFIGTLEAAPGGVTGDPQTGIVESPVFQLTGPKIQFAVSGGKHANTYVGLYTLDGSEVRKASGSNSEVFQPVTWDVPELVGKPVYVRLVDMNRKGWGHVTMDAFSAQGKLLPDETKKRLALAKPEKPSAAAKAALKKRTAAAKRPAKKTQSARTTALSPEEQLAGFTLPEGFVIELVASEEHGVINPIDLTFDDAGRLWTQTGQMYPLDPIAGLRWQQFLDLMKDEDIQNTHPEFKRIKDLYELKARGEDKILIHDDPTKPATGPLHVWADGLAIPQSILPYKDGAYVCHGSELFLLRDTDSDGKSDKMEPVLSGFGYTDTHTMSHLLIRGPGRYIHFSQGALNQGLVTAVASGFQDRVDAACQVRFGLDHQDFEVLSAGPSNMWGLQLRANGQWYGTEANDRAYSVIPWEHGTAVTGAAFRPMRPYQPLLPELHEFRVGGTGISGLEFVEDTEGGFPYEEWKDVALLANPITSTINAVRVQRNPDGTVEAEHLPDFLVAKDDWFRPVNLEFGPDGALYVADFYNKIVSHNEVTTDHPDRDKAHGRIWRIRHESQKSREIPDVTKASPGQLIAHLKAPRLWEKRAAWQQIGDRDLKKLAPSLVELAADSEQTIITRIHALWSLEELGHFDAGLIGSLLTEEDGDLRRETVRSIASFDLEPAKAAALATPFVEDENAMVRSQAIRTLGDLRSPDPAVFAGLIAACKPGLGNNKLGGGYERNLERFLARMALERFPAELKSYLDKFSGNHPAGNLLWAIQALDEDAKQDAFPGIWSKVKSQPMDGETFIAISGMLDNPDVFKAVQPVFQNPDKAENLVGLAIANQSRVQSKKLNEMLIPLVQQLLKNSETVGLGLSAVGKFRIVSLGADVAQIPTMMDDPATLRLLLGAQSVQPKLNADSFIRVAGNASLPFDIRSEAAHLLSAVNQQEAKRLAKELLEKADSYQKGQVASLFSQSKAGGALLCSLLANSVVTPDAFDLSAAERIIQSHPANSQAKKVIAAARKRVAEQRQQAQKRIHHLIDYIAKNPGDPEKGKVTFTSCLTCHKVGSEGQDIAPPLDGSGHRELEHLLTAIVDPDAAVEGGYGLYRVTKLDGSVVEGYLDKKEALGTTVAMMGGVRMFIPQTEIKSQNFVGGRSFMPPAFGQLPEETMADLVAYIGTLKEGGPLQEKTAGAAPSNTVQSTTRQGKVADPTGSGHPALPVVSDPKPKTGKQPNFILIFTDDQGYQDLGSYGSPDIATPNLDRMAAEGMRFTSFYAQTICGPSRTALMTSSYPLRIAQDKNRNETHPVVHSDEITIAEVLKTVGYRSAAFGKWDLATHSQTNWIPELMPRGQGFDYFFGTPSSNDRVVHLVRNEGLIEGNVNMATLTKRYTDEAIEYIEENKEGPFFVYLAHSMPHTRLDASADFKGKSGAGLYGDVIEEIDYNSGRILDKVKELGLDDNTYVIFTSDNGPWLLRKEHGGHALPLRSGKTTCWEGGVRVPCIVRAPGRVPAGSTNDLVTSTMDFMPTFASLAGAELPTDRVLDGKDISGIWHGEQEELDRPFFYYQHHYLRGVRKGDWKVMLKHREGPKSATAKWGHHVAPEDSKPLKAHQLFNLKEDIGESIDLSAKHPDKLAELLKLAEEARADIGDFDRIGKNARFFDDGPNRLGEKVSAKPEQGASTHAASPAVPRPKKKPNFVIIFTDDQGYGDLSCFGGKHISTPRIDEMAREGARLTSFYVAAPVCTPSRAALMTGCYPKRVDMATGSDFGVLLAGDKKGLNPDEITIAEVLKGAGYQTGMFGKWHLGDQPEFLPTRQGFDEFFGIPYSHDIHPYHPQEKWNFPPLALLDQEEVIEMDPDADFLTKRFTERAVDFIKANSEEPFFVYLPHPIPHKPLHVSPPFMDDVDPLIIEALGKEGDRIDYKTRDKLFRQAISEIDWSVGRILDTLREEGVDDNTLVIFFSDNGPAIGSAGPLKGRKGSTFEGGMREPTVIRWPGMIPAAKDNHELMTAMDLLPTFAKLAGAEVPSDRVIDGKDVWPVLAGKAKSPHQNFFYHGGNNLRAVRSANWKLHVKGRKPVALHDLSTDIGEKTNVLAKNPGVAKKLLKEIDAFERDLAANSRPAAFVENPKPLSKK